MNTDKDTKQHENNGLYTLLATVIPKWDCDDCKHYPCLLQELSSDKSKKLKYNECGDHSERGTS